MDELIPLLWVYFTLSISMIGMFGNLTIVMVTMRTKTLHSRCCILIGLLAFFEFVVCVHMVHIRLLMLFKVYFIPASTCFYQSIYGLLAINMQSLLGLFICLDRMYNVSYPVKYHHVPVRYYYATFVVCVAASALMTFIRFIVPDDIHPTVMIVPFCLPLTAIHGFALHFWLFCNFAISVFVVILYWWTHYKCQKLKAKSVHAKTMEAINRILKSLTINFCLYMFTWFVAIISMSVSDLLIPSHSTMIKINQSAGILIVCNSSLRMFVFFLRSPEYRKAICKFYGLGK